MQLIDCEALEAELQQADERRRLIHVGEADAYARHHLPGALLVEPRELVDGTPPASGKLPSLVRLETLFGRLGYHPDCRFFLYDDEGGGWAGRFAWTLDAIGHRSWSYLDGGIHAWAEYGGQLTSGPCDYPAPSTSRAEVRLVIDLDSDHSPVAELTDVLAALDDDAIIVWDVRSREEYLGLRSGSARAGHIPGAVHLDWMDLKDGDRAWRLLESLPELLASRGIDPQKQIITHCQTHHRSGLSYMVGRLLKFSHIRAYHGSWSEWGNRPDTPVETGERTPSE